jgi:hypothetical protein
MVTVFDDVTVLVPTVNVFELDPAATRTLEGTVAVAVLELVSVTVAPPAGADAVSVAVPCEGLPPVTEEGERLIEASAAGGGCATGVTVRLAVFLTPAYVPVMTTVTAEVTDDVLTAKIACVDPPCTTTYCGTVATVDLELVSVTTVPFPDEPPVSVTLP